MQELQLNCKMAPEGSWVWGEEEGLEAPRGGEGEVGGVWEGFDDGNEERIYRPCNKSRLDLTTAVATQTKKNA